MKDQHVFGHRVQAAAFSAIFRDVPDDSKIGGIPAWDLSEMWRIYGQLQRLPELAKRVRKMEKKLEEEKSEP